MKPTLLLLCLVVAVLAVVKTPGQGGPDQRDSAAREKWEYLIVAGPSSTNFSATGNPHMRKEESSFGREAFVLEQHFDKLGANGWQLVSVAGNPQDPVYYFKRARQVKAD